MTTSGQGPSRYRSLHASRRALGRAAPWVRYAIFGVGVSVFLDQVRPMVSDAQFTWGERRVMGLVAVGTLGGFALAGWLVGRVLRAVSDVMEVVVDVAEAAVRSNHLIETQVVPALVRSAAALERLAGPAGPANATASGIDSLRAALEDARAAGDADQVIDCRDALTRHLRGEALHRLDTEVVRWLYDRVQAHTRAGTISPALAALAARVADTFGDTSEGAALHSALPRLRRMAGLCPSCGRPYRGQADACPACAASAPTGPRSRGAASGDHP